MYTEIKFRFLSQIKQLDNIPFDFAPKGVTFGAKSKGRKIRQSLSVP